jgi:hypothetical protein
LDITLIIGDGDRIDSPHASELIKFYEKLLKSSEILLKADRVRVSVWWPSGFEFFGHLDEFDAACSV